MALLVPIENGKVKDNSAASSSSSTKKEEKKSGLDKEAFLQLLVAQMQYQDPLEPMDNTECSAACDVFTAGSNSEHDRQSELWHGQ